MGKFDEILALESIGANYDLSSQDIVDKLMEWDKKYGIEIDDFDEESISINFKALPADLDSLVKEIDDLCPDIIRQGLDNIGLMMESAKENNEEIPENIIKLIEGIDLEAPNSSFELLKKTLLLDKSIGLWWD